ncbi:MAG: DUF5678 domain-containing protein [Candidatus Bathyarchaeia archaeon]|jgi:hypothetical protein
MEIDEIFKLSRENAEWLKENYESLKKKYDNKWVIIQEKKVVHSSSMFDEVMKAARKYDPKTVIVEFMQTQQIAMFF